MKQLNKMEQKAILLDMLEYIDGICRKNNINYTLIGGSLIGIIREGGMIPWDDDIDIGLVSNEYDRLIEVLNNENNPNYKLLTNENNKSYYYPFAKLVCSKTTLHEKKNIDVIDGYGLYIDIFRYSKISEKKLLQKMQYYRIKFLEKSLIRTTLSTGNPNIFKKTLRFFKNIFVKIIGNKNLVKHYNSILRKNDNKEYSCVISNWPIYGINKEIHEANIFDMYIDGNFDGKKVMIIKEYDKFLTRSFGDYMKPPEENNRRSHDLVVYLKED